MNAERLLRLADHLDGVAEDTFDMDYWQRDSNYECKTVACACGHACSIPEFREAGFRLEKDNSGWTLKYGRADGFDAAALFFGLEFWGAYRLFNAAAYPSGGTPKLVATRIRELLTGWQVSTGESF